MSKDEYKIPVGDFHNCRKADIEDIDVGLFDYPGNIGAVSCEDFENISGEDMIRRINEMVVELGPLPKHTQEFSIYAPFLPIGFTAGDYSDPKEQSLFAPNFMMT